MKLDFTTSKASTVGIEWELNLVDLDTLELTPAAGRLLELVGGGEDQPIRKEYLQCMVEIVSGAHDTIGGAIADIETQFHRLQEAAACMNVGLMASGSHPFSHPAAQKPFSNPRYDIVTDKNQWWGRQMAICGTHVHVGIDSRDKALPITWIFARFYPYLLALSASSPFWDGVDSGYASQRTMMFQQLSTNGLPYRFADWAAFEDYIADLVACKMITNVNELRWDVRPSPRFGTVENRIPDSVPTLRELATQAALTQSLGEYLSRALDEGEAADYLAPWLVRENKWRTCRYGLDATIITPNQNERLLPLRDGLAQLIERLSPFAKNLGCYEELSFATEILARGASYERQRRVFAANADDGLLAVATSLLKETQTNTPDWLEADSPTRVGMGIAKPGQVL
ncbi:MAG: glutamate--cysteine ligase [Propionibacteriaceae bacterium]|jgi:carboxylate-amine ligase|nr:glutamate--cysteine ligase [Propionibacteriaceae bacterium]